MTWLARFNSGEFSRLEKTVFFLAINEQILSSSPKQLRKLARKTSKHKYANKNMIEPVVGMLNEVADLLDAEKVSCFNDFAKREGWISSVD